MGDNEKVVVRIHERVVGIADCRPGVEPTHFRAVVDESGNVLREAKTGVCLYMGLYKQKLLLFVGLEPCLQCDDTILYRSCREHAA